MRAGRRWHSLHSSVLPGSNRRPRGDGCSSESDPETCTRASREARPTQLRRIPRARAGPQAAEGLAGRPARAHGPRPGRAGGGVRGGPPPQAPGAWGQCGRRTSSPPSEGWGARASSGGGCPPHRPSRAPRWAPGNKRRLRLELATPHDPCRCFPPRTPCASRGCGWEEAGVAPAVCVCPARLHVTRRGRCAVGGWRVEGGCVASARVCPVEPPRSRHVRRVGPALPTRPSHPPPARRRSRAQWFSGGAVTRTAARARVHRAAAWPTCARARPIPAPQR